MRRGEIYRTTQKLPEPGGKTGFYVVVSRTSLAENPRVSTVVCAPVYGDVSGLNTEVVIGPDEGMARTCGIRCDFLTLLFKSKFTRHVSTLSAAKLRQLNQAIRFALDLSVELPEPEV